MRDQSRNSVRDAGQSSPTEVAGKQVEALDTFAIDWFALRYENPFSRLQFTLLVRPKEFANQAAQGFEFFMPSGSARDAALSRNSLRNASPEAFSRSISHFSTSS